MGTLFYGASRFRVDVEDHALAHLQIAMTAKHRRGEGFLLSWTVATPGGSSRSAVWVHPATDLEFSFTGGRPPEINRAWLEELVRLANTADGLHVTREGDLKPI